MISILLAAALQAGRVDSVVLGGDIMLNSIAVNGKPLDAIGTILRPAGAALANLEIPLTSLTEKTKRKSAKEVAAKNQYILKADPRHAKSIASAGIDLVSLGNNHCMDFRRGRLAQMEAALTANRIEYAGAGEDRGSAMSPAIYTMASGTRTGLISALAFVGAGALAHCTPAGAHSPGIGTLSFGGLIDKRARAYLEELFAEAKRQCDVLVVGLHWGIERQPMPTAYQVALGRACIDAGADVVWGNHPHVLQGAELYKGKPILYSMGNLISSKPGSTGVVKLVYLQGEYNRAQFFPLAISAGRVKPVLGAEAKRRVEAYRNLCRAIIKRYPNPGSRVPL